MNHYLVTGAAGFIGSSLVEKLLKEGHVVTGLDNLSKGKKENIQNHITHPNFMFIEGDIRSEADCQKACQNAEYLLHQAALGSVPESIEYPELYQNNNVIGMETLLKIAAKNQFKKVVFASSCAIYGDEETLPKTENSILKPLSPYATNKIENEKLASYYSSEKNLPCIGLRYFNVYGPKQDPNSAYAAVIGKFITNSLKEQPLQIHGKGDQTRDFVFVKDIVNANLLASKNQNSHYQTYNIGTGIKTSILELATLINTLTQSKSIFQYENEREGDIKHSYTSIKKAAEELIYSPQFLLNEGLKETIEWLKNEAYSHP